MSTVHIGNGPPVPAATPKKKSGTGLAIGLGAAGLTLGLGIGCIGGLAIGGAPSAEKTTAAPQAQDKPAAVTVTTPAPKPVETKAPPGPGSTIEDGTWTVGVDVLAGTYRPRDVAESNCYWQITKSGTNGSDIVQNDIGGGKPTVTLKAGQDFTSARCGIWVKQ